MKPPLFAFGELVTTPGALQAMQEAGQDPMHLILRHVSGDWGDNGAEDQARNYQAIETGLPIYSAYTLENGVQVACVTEADRGRTTFLLMEES